MPLAPLRGTVMGYLRGPRLRLRCSIIDARVPFSLPAATIPTSCIPAVTTPHHYLDSFPILGSLCAVIISVDQISTELKAESVHNYLKRETARPGYFG